MSGGGYLDKYMTRGHLLLAFDKEVERIRRTIVDLDEDRFNSEEEISRAVDALRQTFDNRESMVLYLAERIKFGMVSSLEDEKIRSHVDENVSSVMKAISDSGYLGINPRMPFKRQRGRPKNSKPLIRNSFVRGKLTLEDYRFRFSSDYSKILDTVHRPPIYKIDMYEGFTAAKAVEVFKTLLAAAGNRESEGWVESSPDWRGAFQSGVYKRFRDEQIERGKTKKGHNGCWRLITDGEFDTKSTKGRFALRRITQ